MTMSYKLIDLFAGVGGLSYGFAHDDSFEIVAANEILEPMAKAYSLNHPSVKMYNCDIKDFGLKNLTEDLGIKEGDVDAVVGGPPCQAYSTAGKRAEGDERGMLFQQYYRILSELRPKLFVFENVKGLLSMQGGKLVRNIISLFESLGYHVDIKLLNAADYGAPQIRERVIIVGNNFGGAFPYPQPTHYNPEDPSSFKKGLKPYVTLGEAIGDLTVIGTNEEGFEYAKDPENNYQRLMRKNAPARIMDHNSPNNNPKLVALMKALPDGGTPLDVPKELRPSSGFANCYCRLWWNRPSTTITRNFGCVSSGRCVHPKSPRPLSTREGARIQGFPDDYLFYGSRSDKNLQIGNAVPTFLAAAIKDSVKEFLDNPDKHKLSDANHGELLLPLDF